MIDKRIVLVVIVHKNQSVFSGRLTSPPGTIFASVLAKLVEFVAAIDWQSHSTHDHYNSCSSDKEERIARQHGQLCSKVASPHGHPLGRLVLAVVVLATKDTGASVVVAQTGKFEETISTLVAELCVASVAGHVITSSGSLDVDLTERTLLAVGDAGVCVSFGPLGELFVSPLELFAGDALVPRCVATEAPVMAALFTVDPNVFFTVPPYTRGKLVLFDMTAVGTRFL